MMFSPERILALVHDIPFRADNSYDNRARRLFFRAVVLLVLPLAASFPIFFNASFLAPDEAALLPRSEIWTVRTLQESFKAHHLRFHSPVVMAFLTAEHWAGGGNIDAYHLTAIFLHGASAVLLYFLLRRLGVLGAFLGAALVAVHPAAVQAMFWIDQQDRLWGALFALVFALLYLRLAGVPEPEILDPAFLEFDSTSRRFWRLGPLAAWVFAPVFLLLAVICFPPVGAIALALPILVVCHRRAWRLALGTSFWVQSSAWVLIALAVLVQWGREGGFGAAAANLPGPVTLSGRFLTVGSDAIRAVIRFAFPLPLISDREAHWSSVHSILSYLPILLLLAILVLGWIYRRQTRLAFLECAACLLLLSLTLIEDRHRAEFVQYIPGLDARFFILSLAMLPMFAAAIVLLIDRIRSAVLIDIVRLTASALIVLGLGIETAMASYAYRDTETLLLATHKSNPSSVVVSSRLAEWYLSHNRIDEASKVLDTPQVHQAQTAQTLIIRGRLLESQKDLTGALDALLQAKAIIGSGDVQLMSLLANVYLEQHRFHDANDCFAQALAAHPGDAGLYRDFGVALLNQERLDEAIIQFQNGIEIDPHLAALHLDLAAAYFEKQDFKNAASEIKSVNDIDRNNFDAFYDGGVMLLKMRAFDPARKLLQTAVQLRGDSFEARNNLGVTLAQLGELDKAVYEFQEAVKLKPEDAGAQKNLAMVQAAARRAATRNAPQ